MVTPGGIAGLEPNRRFRGKALVVLVIGLALAGSAYVGHLYLLAEREKERAAEAARPFAEIAKGIRPLVARCQEIGAVNRLSAVTKILVVNFGDGTRHSATDELPEIHRGTPSDPDLVVFAVVDVEEELLRNFYTPRRDGVRLHITVAAVRWPQRSPLGLWVVEADPPRVARLEKGEEGKIPRGDETWKVGYLIKGLMDMPDGMMAPRIAVPRRK
ncbi:MAG: hypothetical protein JNM56_33470 [Planctomycetia bacterium]|nr:hypothetical protein [Planctomycetia bacterium]